MQAFDNFAPPIPYQGEALICVHYSCQNFYKVTDQPAGIHCISVANPQDLSSKAFLVSENSGDEREREVALLTAFYEYLRDKQDARLVHWNMNSADYGFDALASRYRFLTKSDPPFMPSADRIHDLDSMVERRFGPNYARHPKMHSMAVINELGLRFFLKGAEEAEKAASSDFASVQRSTSEKARIIAQLLVRMMDGSIRTATSAGSVPFAGENLEAVRIALALAERFREVERSLMDRHAKRATLLITDEYDAQDLYRSLLRVFFEDVREEEWSPSYAGSGSRIDFLVPDFRLAIELKRTRSGLDSKKLGEELLVDREKYAQHPQTSHLVAVVFDYEGLIKNPRGIEKDLSQQASNDQIAVTVRILDR